MITMNISLMLQLAIDVCDDTRGIEQMCQNENIIGLKHDQKFNLI